MDTKQSDSEYSEQEAVRRGDAVLRHLMGKPPQPHKPLGKRKRAKPRQKPK
jgi:hypothetical protein